MTPELWLGLGIFAAGVAMRLAVSRRFNAAYRRRFDAAPARGWLLARTDDPEVERWRWIMLAGTVIAWIGAIYAILNAAR